VQLRGVEKKFRKSESDLHFLRSQINPHFLFNTLNTLYGTALLEKSGRTAEGIQKLGDMMRFMLHENSLDFIPMSREIEYLNNYIALQKLRTQASPQIRIEKQIEDGPCDRQIAPMLLIPFVENAFKHGISLKNESWVSIRLDCDEQQIRFEVRNSLHTRPENDAEKGKSGVGLKNVVERLSLLYEGRHQLTCGREGNEFVVRLSIQP
jgi:LytS/YehU family sensor histidine kinase